MRQVADTHYDLLGSRYDVQHGSRGDPAEALDAGFFSSSDEEDEEEGKQEGDEGAQPRSTAYIDRVGDSDDDDEGEDMAGDANACPLMVRRLLAAERVCPPTAAPSLFTSVTLLYKRVVEEKRETEVVASSTGGKDSGASHLA